MDPGRLARQRQADRQPRLPLGWQRLRPRRGQPAELRLRSDDRQPGVGAGRPCRCVGGLRFVGVDGAPGRAVEVRQEQLPAARRHRLFDQREDGDARRLREVLPQPDRPVVQQRVQPGDAPDRVERRQPHADLRARQPVPERGPDAPGQLARAADVPRTQPRLLEPGLRRAERAPVLGWRAARTAVGRRPRGELRRQPHLRDAVGVERLQRTVGRLPASVRSDARRQPRVLRPAAAQPVLPGGRVRGHEPIHQPDAVAVRAGASVPGVLGLRAGIGRRCSRATA